MDCTVRRSLAGILLPPILLRTSNQLTDSCSIKEHCLPLAVTDLHDFSKTHEHVAFPMERQHPFGPVEAIVCFNGGIFLQTSLTFIEAAPA